MAFPAVERILLERCSSGLWQFCWRDARRCSVGQDVSQPAWRTLPATLLLPAFMRDGFPGDAFGSVYTALRFVFLLGSRFAAPAAYDILPYWTAFQHIATIPW
jgi:hypothetical protein